MAQQAEAEQQCGKIGNCLTTVFISTVLEDFYNINHHERDNSLSNFSLHATTAGNPGEQPVNIPRRSRGHYCVRAAQSGLYRVANATPCFRLGHLIGGQSLPHVQLVQTLVFLLLVAYVGTNHRFIAPHRRYEIASRPEMLPSKLLRRSPLPGPDESRSCPLRITHHRRRCVLRRN